MTSRELFNAAKNVTFATRMIKSLLKEEGEGGDHKYIGKVTLPNGNIKYIYPGEVEGSQIHGNTSHELNALSHDMAAGKTQTPEEYEGHAMGSLHSQHMASGGDDSSWNAQHEKSPGFDIAPIKDIPDPAGSTPEHQQQHDDLYDQVHADAGSRPGGSGYHSHLGRLIDQHIDGDTEGALEAAKNVNANSGKIFHQEYREPIAQLSQETHDYISSTTPAQASRHRENYDLAKPPAEFSNRDRPKRGSAGEYQWLRDRKEALD